MFNLTEHDPTVTVVVCNLPPDLASDDLELYFESEKYSGGGNIAEISIKKAQRKAIIEFEDPEGK